MDYAWLVVSLLGFWLLTPVIATYMAILCPAFFFILSFVITTYSVYAGIGGAIGCTLNLLVGYGIIPKFGFLNRFKSKGMLSSWCYLVSFAAAILNKYTINYDLKTSNLLVLFITLGAILITFVYIYRHSRKHGKFNEEVERYRQSVVKAKVVEKYPEQSKWAVYLYFNNGREDWNYAVPSSDHAMDPVHNDLTYVFDSKEDAVSYVKDFFTQASIVEA